MAAPSPPLVVPDHFLLSGKSTANKAGPDYISLAFQRQSCNSLVPHTDFLFLRITHKLIIKSFVFTLVLASTARLCTAKNIDKTTPTYIPA